MRASATVVVLAVLATGCGSYSEEKADRASEGTSTGDELEGSTSYGLLSLVAPSGERPVPEDVYRVFKRPPTAADERAAATSGLSDFDQHVASGHATDLGRVRMDAARIVLAPVSGAGTALVAAPTTVKGVCFTVVPNGGGGCGFPGEDGLDLAGTSDGPGALIFGIVGNRIERVDIVAAGRIVRARLGENGYAARLESDDFASLEAVVLHRVDGTTERIELP